MTIAVTYDNGQVFQHFGHTAFFKLYTVNNGIIESSRIVSTNGSGHSALATLLSGFKVDALICGGIGMGARIALDNADIALYPGVSGSADEAAAALAAGKLGYDADATCNHHHEDGHSCGGDSCSSHEGHCCH